MEFISVNRLLKFRPNQLEHVRKHHNFEKSEDMGRAVDVLEDWLKMQEHFSKKDLPRTYMERSIITSKGSMERAKNKIDKLFTFRTIMPDFFGENLTNNKFEDSKGMDLAFVPQPTSENYRICFLKSNEPPYSYSQILNCYRCMIMMCEYMAANDYCDGVIILVDYTETNLIELVKSINLTQLKEVLTIVIEGFGMRVKGIHLLTPSKAVDTIVTIVKQFLGAKLGQRILVHKNITTLYQHVPQDILPVEYGGKEKSFKELHDDLMNEITGEDFVGYIEEMNKAKTNESSRQTNSLNDQYLSLAGSFRTLSVD